jgi:hypothetical protein
VRRREPEHIPIDAEDQRVVGAAHPRGILGDCVEYRLKMRRRARDHAQDLAGRRLLLLRLLQAFLELPAPGGFVLQ